MARVPNYQPVLGAACDAGLYCDPEIAFPRLWAGRGRWEPGQPLHTFVDDYRQEFFWRRPVEGLIVALSAGIATAPDYTVYTDDPRPLALYEGWRSATVAQYWQRHGVTVVPVVSFGTDVQRYVAAGSAWAVRVVNCERWRERLREFVDRSRCALLLAFGLKLQEPPCPVLPLSLSSGKLAAQKEG